MQLPFMLDQLLVLCHSLLCSVPYSTGRPKAWRWCPSVIRAQDIFLRKVRSSVLQLYFFLPFPTYPLLVILVSCWFGHQWYTLIVYLPRSSAMDSKSMSLCWHISLLKLRFLCRPAGGTTNSFRFTQSGTICTQNTSETCSAKGTAKIGRPKEVVLVSKLEQNKLRALRRQFCSPLWEILLSKLKKTLTSCAH